MIKSIVFANLKIHGYQKFDKPKPLDPSWTNELLQAGATVAQIRKCVTIAPNTVYLHSICDYLVNRAHPKCQHIRYEFCTIIYPSFVLVTVMPIFTPLYICHLDKTDIEKTSTTQINHCWETLLSYNDAYLLNIFSATALTKIKAGDRSDFTWHHDLQRGVMCLVSANDHRTCRHTGGNAIWSYGS